MKTKKPRRIPHRAAVEREPPVADLAVGGPVAFEPGEKWTDLPTPREIELTRAEQEKLVEVLSTPAPATPALTDARRRAEELFGHSAPAPSTPAINDPAVEFQREIMARRRPDERTADDAKWAQACKQLDALVAFGPMPRVMETANGPRDSLAIVRELRDEIRRQIALRWYDDPYFIAVSKRVEQLYDETARRLPPMAVAR